MGRSGPSAGGRPGHFVSRWSFERSRMIQTPSWSRQLTFRATCRAPHVRMPAPADPFLPQLARGPAKLPPAEAGEGARAGEAERLGNLAEPGRSTEEAKSSFAPEPAVERLHRRPSIREAPMQRPHRDPGLGRRTLRPRQEDADHEPLEARSFEGRLGAGRRLPAREDSKPDRGQIARFRDTRVLPSPMRV